MNNILEMTFFFFLEDGGGRNKIGVGDEGVQAARYSNIRYERI